MLITPDLFVSIYIHTYIYIYIYIDRYNIELKLLIMTLAKDTSTTICSHKVTSDVSIFLNRPLISESFTIEVCISI